MKSSRWFRRRKAAESRRQERREARQRPRRRFEAESLEPRVLLSADLSLLETGLTQDLFPALQDLLDSAVFDESVPLIGRQLATEVPGRIATSIGDALAGFSLDDNITIDEIRGGLITELGSLFDSSAGPLQVIGSESSDEVLFQLTLSDTIQTRLDADLALGEDAFLQVLLDVEDRVHLNLDWSFDLAFGVNETDFFLVTSALNELEVGFDATLLANFAGKGPLGIFAAEMQYRGPSFFSGVYQIDFQDVGAQDDRVATSELASDLGVHATLDGSGNASLAVDASFFPEFLGEDGLSDSERKFLFNLKVMSDVDITYDFDRADTQGSNQFGADPVIEFSNVQLDTAEYLGGFFSPVIEALRPIFAPLQPIFDTLTSPVPGISDISEFIGEGEITFIDLALLSDFLPSDEPDSEGNEDEDPKDKSKPKATGSKVAAAFEALNLVSTLVTSPLPGDESGGPPAENADLGSFKIIAKKKLRKADDPDPDPDPEPDPKPDLEVVEEQANAEAKDSVTKSSLLFAKLDGDLSFPLLDDPRQIFSLMRGDTNVSMFEFGFGLDLRLIFKASYPLFPGLSVNLQLAAGMIVDLDFGFDTLGVKRLSQALDWSDREALAASLDSNQELLRQGFFIDDHLSPGATDGDLTPQNFTPGGEFIQGPALDAPELKFFAQISVGAELGGSIGIAEVRAGVDIPFRLDILFDINDLPDPIPVADLPDPEPETFRELFPADPADFSYDGRVRLHEFDLILAADKLALFDAEGQFSIAVEAFLRAEIGVDPFTITLIDKRWSLFSFVLFNFDVITPLPDEDVLAGVVLDPPVFASQPNEFGEVTLFMGPTADQRENTSLTGPGRDSETDESFQIISLGATDPNNAGAGETLEIIYLGKFRQTVENVKKVVAVGGDGNDTIEVAKGVAAEVDFAGGTGNDKLVYRGTGRALLKGDEGNDVLIGGEGDDVLIGGSDLDDPDEGDRDGDYLEGNGGADILIGDLGAVIGDVVQLASGGTGPGRDELRGEDGEDQLFGGRGADLLVGGAEIDQLTGGDGGDSYVWDVGDGDDVVVEATGDSGADQFVLGGGTQRVGGSGSNQFVAKDDTISLGGNADGHVEIETDDGSLLLNDIERISVAAGGGSDTVTLRSLAGTDVERMAIDLASTVESGAATMDAVIFEGSTAGDMVTVEGDFQSVFQQDLATLQVLPDAEQAVVRITDATADAIEIFVVNSDPSRDRLTLKGEAGADQLVVSAGSDGLRVPDLIAVTLEGGADADTLRSVYGTTTVIGGEGDDTLIVSDDDAGDGRPTVTLDADSVVIARPDFSEDDVVRYSEFEHFELELGHADTGSELRVLATIPGSVVVRGSVGDDTLFIEAIDGETRVELGPVLPDAADADLAAKYRSVVNHVVLGDRDGAPVFIAEDLDIQGSAGFDRLTYDSSRDAMDRNVTVGLTSVLGLAVPASSAVTFDENVEELSLLMGLGADRVVVPNLTRRVTVTGGDGKDEVEATLLGAPTGGWNAPVIPSYAGGGNNDPAVVTHAVEDVTFNNEGNTQATNWLVVDDLGDGANSLRAGVDGVFDPFSPGAYDQLLLRAYGADTTTLNLGSGSDAVRVWDVKSETFVNTRAGDDQVVVGDGRPGALRDLSDLLAPLWLDGGGDDGDALRVDNAANIIGNREGVIDATRLSGFTMEAEAFIDYSGTGPEEDYDAFSTLNVDLSDASDLIRVRGTSIETHLHTAGGSDRVTIEGSAAELFVETGTGADEVSVRGAAGTLHLDAGDGGVLEFDVSASTNPISAAHLGQSGSEAQLTGLGPIADARFQRFRLTTLELGQNNDELELDLGLDPLPLEIRAGAGDDTIRVKRVGDITRIEGGSGEDRVVVDVSDRDPVLAANLAQDLIVGFETPIETLEVDNHQYATGVEWSVEDGNLSADGTRILLVDGADEVYIRAGSESDHLRVAEQASPVEASLDGNRVEIETGVVVLEAVGFTTLDDVALDIADVLTFDSLVDGVASHPEAGFELESSTTIARNDAFGAAASAGSVGDTFTLRRAGGGAFALYRVGLGSEVSGSHSVTLTGTTLVGKTVSATFVVEGEQPLQSFDLPGDFTALASVSWAPGDTIVGDLTVVELLDAPTSSAPDAVDPTTLPAAATELQIDTELLTLTLNGVELDDTYNGTKFLAEHVSGGNIAQFRFAGDLVIGDGTLVTAVGDRPVPMLDFPDFDALTPVATGSDAIINRPSSPGPFHPDVRADDFAAVWTGEFQIIQQFVRNCGIFCDYTVTHNGNVTFELTSDSGSRLFVNDILVIDNSGVDGTRTESATIGLVASEFHPFGLGALIKHQIRVEYFDHTGDAGIQLKYSTSYSGVQHGTFGGPNIPRHESYAGVLSTNSQAVGLVGPLTTEYYAPSSSARGVSLWAADDVIIGDNVSFNFSADGRVAGPGGGDAGNLVPGGAGGTIDGRGSWPAFGGWGGHPNPVPGVSGGSGGLGGVGGSNEGDPGLPGSAGLGNGGGGGGGGAGGDRGGPSSEGENGHSGGSGGAGGHGGDGDGHSWSNEGGVGINGRGVLDAGQRSLPLGGSGRGGIGGAWGVDGDDGSVGNNGRGGGSGGSGSNSSNTLQISGGGGGASGSSGGGGGSGGGGTGGEGATGGRGTDGGFLESGDDGPGGAGGGGGGSGGAGGNGGAGGAGGAGGGAFEILAQGRVIVGASELAARGGAGSAGEAGAQGLPGSLGLAGGGLGAGTGGNGGSGGAGGAGGAGGGGAGGTVKLFGTVLDSGAASVDTSGGVGGAGATQGGSGRLILGSNASGGVPLTNVTPDTFDGPREGNPFIIADDSETAPIADLLGGAELFGLLGGVSANASDLAFLGVDAPADAVAAIYRMDVGPAGYDVDYEAFDMLLFVNLTDLALLNPSFGVAQDDANSFFARGLETGGVATDARFGGSGVDTTLDALAPHSVWATLIPDTDDDPLDGDDTTNDYVNASVGSIQAPAPGIAHQKLVDTQVAYITAPQPSLAGATELPGLDALAASASGEHVYGVNAANDVLVVLGGDLSQRQTFKDGLDGLDGLGGASAVAATQEHVYVAAGADAAIARFARAASTGNLSYDGVTTESSGRAVFEALVLNANGDRLYTAGADGVVSFARDAVTGSLTQTSALTTAVGNVVDLAVSGGHVYAVSDSGDTLWVLDAGDLSTLESHTGDAKGLDGASGVALSADGFLYVTGRDGSTLASFERDPADGKLQLVEVLRQGVGGVRGLVDADDVIVSSDDGFVYVTSSAGTLAIFERDSTAGTLQLAQLLRGRTGLDAPSAIAGGSNGVVYIASEQGAGSTNGGVASFAPVPALVDKTGGFSVRFDSLERLELATGTQDDVIRQVNAALVDELDISGGGGFDTVDLLNVSGATTVTTGDGRDTVTVRSTTAGSDVRVTLVTAGGSDTVVLTGVGAENYFDVDMGAGDDTAQIQGRDLPPSATLILKGGDDTDTLKFDSGGSPVTPQSPVTPDGSLAVNLAAEGLPNPGSVNYTSIESIPNFNPAVIDAGGLYATSEGQGFTLDASADPATNTAIVSRRWDLNGDGVFGEVVGIDTPVSWAELVALGLGDDGVYDIVLEVVDDQGVRTTAATILTIANQVPVALFDPSGDVEVGAEHRVSLGASSDEGDDTISEWTVDWGDGTVETFGSDATSVAHTYLDTGDFTVEVSFRDEDLRDGNLPGESRDEDYGPKSGVVAVSAASPDAGGPYAIREGEELVLAGSAVGTPALSWDINGDGVFGDAAGADVTLSWLDLESLGIANDGGFAVTLRATYTDGQFADASAAFSVANAAPTGALSNRGPVDEGQSVVLDVTATDASATDRGEGFLYSYDFDNDGNFEVLNSEDASITVDGSELTQSGLQVMRAVVANRDGSPGTELFTSVEVRDVAPDISIVRPPTGLEGSAFGIALSASDDGDDVVTSWTLDWGDGAQTTIAGATPNVSHVYADDGIYDVTVSATDADGVHEATAQVEILNVAPTLFIAGASSVGEGIAYDLFLEGTDPGEDTLVTWTIDWGDGNVESVAASLGSARHVYADDGSYEIVATANDEDGSFAVSQVAVLAEAAAPEGPISALPSAPGDRLQLSVVDVAPTATLAGVTQIDEGGSFRLAISPPFDLGDDTVVEYLIDWGDGGPIEVVDAPAANTAGFVGTPTFNHVYADGGSSYDVQVTLRNEDGDHALDVLQVAVDNVAPTIVLAGTSAVPEGTAYALTLGAVRDPGEDTVTSYLVDWGDGATDTFGSAGEVAHTYSGAALRTITVDLVDEDGTHLAAGTLEVEVFDVAPVLGVGGSLSIHEGTRFDLQIGGFADAGTGFADFQINGYTVDWGDGASETFSAADVAAAGGELGHTYLEGDADYPISVTVLADEGTFSDAAVLSVKVLNVAPTIGSLTNTASVIGRVGENASVFITGRFTDQGILDTHTATIDWGDGTQEAAPITQGNATGRVDSSHAYTQGGRYNIRVTVTDDDGGSTVETTTAYVTGTGLHDGVLHIVGTAGKDNVEVKPKGKHGDIEVKAKLQDEKGRKKHRPRGGGGPFNPALRQDIKRTYAGAEVESILILLGAADDKAKVDKKIEVPVTIEGGAGRDDLKAEGNGDATLLGGDGDDKLKGGKGNDYLDGGAGKDKLEGKDGDDTLLGGEGNDDLKGGKGDDYLDGGDGNDKLKGEDGDDTLLGRAGNDDLNGGKGNDHLDGGDDNDKLKGEDGDDTLLGGPGLDELDGGKGNNILDPGPEPFTVTVVGGEPSEDEILYYEASEISFGA